MAGCFFCIRIVREMALHCLRKTKSDCGFRAVSGMQTGGKLQQAFGICRKPPASYSKVSAQLINLTTTLCPDFSLVANCLRQMIRFHNSPQKPATLGSASEEKVNFWKSDLNKSRFCQRMLTFVPFNFRYTRKIQN